MNTDKANVVALPTLICAADQISPYTPLAFSICFEIKCVSLCLYILEN